MTTIAVAVIVVVDCNKHSMSFGGMWRAEYTDGVMMVMTTMTGAGEDDDNNSLCFVVLCPDFFL